MMARRKSSGGQALLFADADEPMGRGAYGQAVSDLDYPPPTPPVAPLSEQEHREVIAAVDAFEAAHEEASEDLVEALEQAPARESVSAPKLADPKPASPPPSDGFPRKPLDPALKGFLEREQAANRSAAAAWRANGHLLRAMARAIEFIRADRGPTAAAVLEVAKEDVERGREFRDVVEDEGGTGDVRG